MTTGHPHVGHACTLRGGASASHFLRSKWKLVWETADESLCFSFKLDHQVFLIQTSESLPNTGEYSGSGHVTQKCVILGQMWTRQQVKNKPNKQKVLNTVRPNPGSQTHRSQQSLRSGLLPKIGAIKLCNQGLETSGPESDWPSGAPGGWSLKCFKIL